MLLTMNMLSRALFIVVPIALSASTARDREPNAEAHIRGVSEGSITVELTVGEDGEVSLPLDKGMPIYSLEFKAKDERVEIATRSNRAIILGGFWVPDKYNRIERESTFRTQLHAGPDMVSPSSGRVLESFISTAKATSTVQVKCTFLAEIDGIRSHIGGPPFESTYEKIKTWLPGGGEKSSRKPYSNLIKVGVLLAGSLALVLGFKTIIHSRNIVTKTD